MTKSDIDTLKAITHVKFHKCPVCKLETMRITKKKKIKFCFNCGKDII